MGHELIPGTCPPLYPCLFNIFLETIHVTENLKTYQIMYLFYGD